MAAVDVADEKFDTNSTPKKRARTKKERQKLFLATFAEHANVLKAAQAADVHRTTVYQWLEHDEDFSFAYNLAKEDAKDVLRDEIKRRAVDGWDEPVYQFGVLAGKVRKYSDTLLIFHAKALMPEYREKHAIELSGNVTVERVDYSKFSAEELATLEEMAKRATNGNS